MSEKSALPPPAHPGLVFRNPGRLSPKGHAEYAAKWLRDHPDDPHKIYIERIREAAESHPENLTEEILRFCEVLESEKKSGGDQGAQEIPTLP